MASPRAQPKTWPQPEQAQHWARTKIMGNHCEPQRHCQDSARPNPDLKKCQTQSIANTRPHKKHGQVQSAPKTWPQPEHAQNWARTNRIGNHCKAQSHCQHRVRPKSELNVPDPKHSKHKARPNSSYAQTRPKPKSGPDHTKARPDQHQTNKRGHRQCQTKLRPRHGQTQINSMARQQQQPHPKHDQTPLRSKAWPDSGQTQAQPQPNHTHNRVRPRA